MSAWLSSDAPLVPDLILHLIFKLAYVKMMNEVQQSFWDEVMCEDDENLIDLAAPLMFNAGIRFSDLSQENREWARLFPNFLLPFPEHSHPDIRNLTLTF